MMPIMYIVTGIVTMIWPEGAGGTSISSITRIFGVPFIAGLAMVISGLLALSAVLLERRVGRWFSLLITPQLWMVWLAAIGPYYAITKSHYADGVIRHRAFIFNDQVIYIVVGLMFTYALLVSSGFLFTWTNKPSSR
jgi:hypothetical protein